jgi:uncharacterized protein (TIGR00255 family)
MNAMAEDSTEAGGTVPYLCEFSQRTADLDMIRSMTGYGKSECVIGGLACTIETRCVNGRYLELSVRMPKEWSAKEGQVRELVREHVVRGSLNIFIRTDEKVQADQVRLDVATARAYVNAIRTMRDELGLEGDVRMEHLLQFPAIFNAPSSDDGEQDVWPQLRDGLATALQGLNEMRTREGAELARDLTARCDAIAEGLVEVERRSAERIPMERERLRERVRQVVDEGSIDDARMHLEITLLADKLDIAEECVRLRSHMKHFKQYMADEAQAGRKMNFLLQEMNREVNTIGSKTNDAEIARIVVGMKEELERMREQVQNVE